ncbi:PREDICTED: predicted GPI-anchored protein 58 [Tauraco erythrolophus]|uniref:predicted GPI-anchored protein 58 n=1 Tax=Tauraco erythrolophus TaxID=121530 RepID=UPI000523C281|nr:PREDICTED: predicted GPI-anchored protein 58 [Tauraco erythrolophus]
MQKWTVERKEKELPDSDESASEAPEGDDELSEGRLILDSMGSAPVAPTLSSDAEKVVGTAWRLYTSLRDYVPPKYAPLCDFTMPEYPFGHDKVSERPPPFTPTAPPSSSASQPVTSVNTAESVLPTAPPFASQLGQTPQGPFPGMAPWFSAAPFPVTSCPAPSPIAFSYLPQAQMEQPPTMHFVIHQVMVVLQGVSQQLTALMEMLQQATAAGSVPGQPGLAVLTGPATAPEVAPSVSLTAPAVAPLQIAVPPQASTA